MEATHFQDILPVYFSRIFPFEDLYQWLSYGETNTFALREFAFNFQGDRYLRYQTYSGLDDLKNEVKKLKPVKIDIGAVYNISPSNNAKETGFYSQQKELIFDIDLTDYDEVRTCCFGVNICCKCWKFMTVAVKILDIALREDFGFMHILWVFSGRRGLHCWVCDKNARFARASSRFGIANYLQLVSGGEYKKKKVEIKDKIHHSIRRALTIIEPIFIEMCIEEQNVLGVKEKVDKFLGIFDESLRIDVRNVLDQYQTSILKWQAFVKYYKNQIELGNEMWSKTPFLIEEIMIQYTYPRLDINVTLGMNHLLKAPFCVHPKTGKIGVVLNPETIEQFDPGNVPTILELMNEIDNYDAMAIRRGIPMQDLKKIPDVTKTSLIKSVNFFRKFVDDLKNLPPRSDL